MFLCRGELDLCGDTLLTADNPEQDSDAVLFAKLGISPSETADIGHAEAAE